MVIARKLMFLKCSCQKSLEKNGGRPVFSKSWQAARKFSKNHSVKIDLKAPGKSCGNIWWQCDEIYFVVNLGQKYEGDLDIRYIYHFSYYILIFFKCYDFTVLQIKKLSYRMVVTLFSLLVISHIECIVSALLFKGGWV